MSQTQLVRGLFRSFLRWNRKKYILESRFRINPLDFQCQDLFPVSSIIQDASGYQAAVYRAFRETEFSPKAVNNAVRILRQLNDFGQQIKETSEKRRLNSNDQTISYAKFKIGQVVQHKGTKVRALVIGWKINFTRKLQTVQIISDFDDNNKQTSYDISIRPEFVAAHDLELVEDPRMMRIFHFDTDKYFVAFDSIHQRYIPNTELLYLYPRDFDGIYNVEKHGDSYPCGLSDSDRKFLSRVDNLICDQGEQINNLAIKFFPWRKESNLPSSIRNDDDDAEINSRIISDQILEEIWWRIGHVRQSHGGTIPSSIRLKNMGSEISHISNKSMSYVEGFNMSLNYADVPLSSLLPPKQIHLGGTKKVDYELFHHQFQQQVHALHAPWHSIRNIYHRFGHFNELITHLDQLLQLRYQSRGVAFHTSLSTMSINESTSSLSSSKRRFRVKLQHKEFNIAVQQYMQATQKVYPTRFQVGQVVRHKKYRYRGIVTGYDQRPLQQASKRSDLLANAGSAIPRDQEQPFYRLLVDERDELLFREGGHEHGQLVFDHTYLPEDCLEEVTSSSKQDQHHLIVSHPEISRYFLGWNANFQRFRPRHQLKYAHPEGEHRLPDTYPKLQILQALDERIIAEEDAEDCAPLPPTPPSSARNRALFAQVGGVAGLQSEEEAVALATAITSRTTKKVQPSLTEGSSPPQNSGIINDPRLYKALVRSILREEVKIYENIDLFLITLRQHIDAFMGTVLQRHISRLQLVQQMQQQGHKEASSNTLMPTSIGGPPNDEQTPIGKPTITSRGRAKRRKPPTVATSIENSTVLPDHEHLITLELADLQRLLQLAPLRFAALDVDLFMFKVLATVHPNHSQSHDLHALIRMGASHALRGNFAETIRAMDIAQSIEPLFFEAYYKQALAWSRLGDTHAVIKQSLQCLALYPNHQGAHYLLALAYSNTKRRDEAVEVIRQGLRLNPWAFNLASDLKTLLKE